MALPRGTRDRRGPDPGAATCAGCPGIRAPGRRAVSTCRRHLQTSAAGSLLGLYMTRMSCKPPDIYIWYWVCKCLSMAGLSLGQRDLAATREQLAQWFEHKFGAPADVGELRPANRAAGWSSESLLFT